MRHRTPSPVALVLWGWTLAGLTAFSLRLVGLWGGR